MFYALYYTLKTLFKKIFNYYVIKGHLDLHFHEGQQEIFSEDRTCLTVYSAW